MDAVASRGSGFGYRWREGRGEEGGEGKGGGRGDEGGKKTKEITVSESTSARGRIEEKKIENDGSGRDSDSITFHLQEHTDSKHWSARTLPALPARAEEMSRPG